MPDDTFMGVPRSKITWHPTIDYNRCDLCGGVPQCQKFCPHGVYAMTEDAKKIIIKTPTNCVVFCRACSKVCAADALQFPEKRDVLEKIKALRASTE